MKKKALIFRASPAMGDMIFISFVPRQLKERGYKQVNLANWDSNKFVFENNPYVDNIISLDEIKEDFEKQKAMWEKEYDLFDLRFTVEYNYLEKSHQVEYTIEERRKRADGKNYYLDALSKYKLSGKKGELYLSDREKLEIDKYTLQDRRRILWQPLGGGRNKKIIYMNAYINEIAKKMPEIEHWICGTAEQQTPIRIKNDKVIIKDMRGVWTPRQTLYMTKIFDLTISPESFVANIAGAFDIPNMIFFSHSKPENLSKFFKKSYSVIPTCQCSPCYLLITDFRRCINLKQRAYARKQEEFCLYRDAKNIYRGIGFRCCIDVDHESIVKKILGIMRKISLGIMKS